ncbi:hypothetical protein [Streptomyces rapamycinicus]|uniref:Sodium:proton antiporter n=2 Tax=Streptomyces rapamycinicus TaxID=1226757 RepID=A0A0A0NFG8_STRRN|nr:hypothetical protein M271_22200 [Streptomyces rapamycinicus NRRL 5491]MBB4783548.1 hypothetical protein [Streptomyces rapamycinicus]RLV80978.1 sodium:proton antiporter [Streptomyces rapamycinicus NRRL 5491]
MAGQSLIPVIVSAREKILDHEAYAHASASPLDDHDEPEPQLAAA